ncbi:MAG: hypothetical protein ACOX5F_04280 [Anaerovoracaceae bacterium]|jgi:cellulose biosynthesis protein BcsQ
MIRLLLLEKDLEYGYMLGKTISNLHNNFDVSVSTLESHIQLGKDKGYDLTLVGGYSFDDQMLSSLKNMIILSEDPVMGLDHQLNQYENNSNPYLKVYKYSKVSQLISDLSYLFNRLTGKKSLIKASGDTKIFSFYSTQDGVGTSSISLSTARELARYRDKIVLYLSFEEIPSSNIYIKEHNKDRCLSDFLYYLFEKKQDNISLSLEGFNLQDEYGVYYFSLGDGINELSTLPKDELAEFFKILLSTKKFDYIFLDLNSRLREETFYLLNLSKAVLIIETPCIVNQYKNNIFLKYATLINQDGFLREMTLIRNRVNSYADPIIEESPYAMEKEADILIEEDADSFEIIDGIVNININNVFGLSIKSLADKILIY